jgi:hypothetical protein
VTARGTATATATATLTGAVILTEPGSAAVVATEVAVVEAAVAVAAEAAVAAAVAPTPTLSQLKPSLQTPASPMVAVLLTAERGRGATVMRFVNVKVTYRTRVVGNTLIAKQSRIMRLVPIYIDTFLTVSEA